MNTVPEEFPCGWCVDAAMWAGAAISTVFGLYVLAYWLAARIAA